MAQALSNKKNTINVSIVRMFDLSFIVCKFSFPFNKYFPKNVWFYIFQSE